MVAAMARKQVLVQLDDGEVEALDRLAEANDETRSRLIRRAIDLYLQAVDEGLAEVRYAEAYRRIPEQLDEFAGLRSIAEWPKP
jgi:predicted transcriptional regulator